MVLRPRFLRNRGPAKQEPEPGRSPDPTIARAPERERAPEPEHEVIAELPREWNLWDLERVARERTSKDVAKNEERAYLLIYLRDFAGPDGTLPTDFDSLVRDAFGDLLHVVAT